MLSFLYRLVESYHREHGLHPNLLYLNEPHYRKLLECLPNLDGPERVARFLQMQIIISSEAVHPYVAWLPSSAPSKTTRDRARLS